MSRSAEVYSRFNGLAVNYKVILAIFAGAILFQMWLEFATEESAALDISSLALFTFEVAIAGFAFYLACRYDFSQIFGRSFLFFGTGFLALAAADVLDTFGMIPAFVEILPGAFIPAHSLSYFILYGGVTGFMLINIVDLNSGFGRKNVFFVVLPIMAFLVGVFYWITYADYGTFDHVLHYCGLSVVGTSMVAAMSVVGVRVLFRKTLGRAWRIYMYGFLTFAIGDVVFHYFDTMLLYHDAHFANVFMYASYALLIYGFYKNVRVF